MEDKSVLDVLIELGTPIISLAVTDAGDITAKVLGSPRPREANKIVGAAKPFDNDTLFQACSLSKPITALGVIKLCQNRKLDLDAPITQYLSPEVVSWISKPNTQAIVSQITLRHLLSHTSGMPSLAFDGYTIPQIPNLKQILRVLQKPFHQIMDEVIIQPLKMSRSTFQILPAIEKNYAPAYFNGKTKSEPDHHLYSQSTACGLWTTPTDILKAVQTVQWSLESDDFLEARWAKIMLAEVNDSSMALGCDGAEPDDEDMNDARKNVPKDCGICVVTSSALGEVLQDKILAALPYLKGWPAWSPRRLIPFIHRGEMIDSKAKEWCGQWGPGQWNLLNVDRLCLRFGTLPTMGLHVAAVPSKQYEEGSSIDLVPDGMEMMLRLGWQDRSRIVEIWQGGEATILHQKITE
ncbi:hypothetical protein G7Y89_g14833 [Cudoniella acicularis]|uniref:Beta-lactamase-related domain-containing protein n=1 Tax=Cudoniella acicularis TaxID=354080 RepID=A0A8H4QYI3_9HELO|nr:hypothetical protein G7Y89_g14833 [Cudoniella acicularis]